MPKINSLYELIKQKSQELGRSVKIICDWDDTIQAYQPMVLYELCKECKDSPDPFECFFKNWSMKIDEIKEKNDFYKQAPFISTADDLLLAVKEGLISELTFLSYFNKLRFPNGDARKAEKFWKTFGKLSWWAKVDMKLTSSFNKPQWILENCLDFDIFIDDLPATISESVKIFSDDKIFVIPNQDLNFGINSRRVEGKNVYHLQVEVSSLKDESFEVNQKNAVNYEYESKIIYRSDYGDKIN